MRQERQSWREAVFSDTGILILLALGLVLLHVLTNYQYGFHRDELDTLDNARYLAWGYVAYPPLTPFLARLGLELCGPSLVGLRLLAAIAQGVVMVLVGLMARALGGGRFAQVVAALAVAIAPVSLAAGVMLHYFSFDYLWWVLAAYCVVRLLQTENPRWWLGVGAAIGLGMMTKYTMAFFVVGIIAGVLLTRVRRDLLKPWLWAGAALALLIFLPNLIWQAQHGFISLDFLQSIHARDIAWGRTQGYLPEQLLVAANPLTIPLWLAGLYFYFFSAPGRRFRMLGWMYLVPFVLLLVTQGRSYYVAPAYPMLVAAGIVMVERWLRRLSVGRARLVRGLVWASLIVGGALAALIALPLAPVNSSIWEMANGVSDNFREMVGWPELVASVAEVYAQLPADEQQHTGILAGNYGETGAINLYGPAYDLPQAISGGNSAWYRGYGDPAPETVIVVGYQPDDLVPYFRSCEEAGRVTNPYGIDNEESVYHPIISLCREARQPWPEFWGELQQFQ